MQKQSTSSIIIAIIMILAAALSRVFLYPESFSPIIGMAIFAGAVIKDKRLAFALPIFSMLLSDVLFEVSGKAPGFWGWGQIVNYALLAIITIGSFNLKWKKVPNVIAQTVGSTILFFLLSNISVFVFDYFSATPYYAHSFQGLVDCVAAGLPFIRKSLWVDLLFSGALFGIYYLVTEHSFSKTKIAA